jgi:uroporphyrin-III C-methyltransferase
VQSTTVPQTTGLAGEVSPMQFDLDPQGRKVVIFGDAGGTRQIARRFLAAGATVTLALTGAAPDPADRLQTVRYVAQPNAEDTAGLLRLIGPAWLVADVGASAALGARIRGLAGPLHLLLVHEEPAARHGQVTLVGGGPGRTGLLTVEAVDALRRADVVFYDRLAPTAELAGLAPAATLHDVGKSPYHHPVGQRRIEDLMMEAARAGASVVRLKGGDPFVFGRGGEELQACAAAGIPVRVVPGVSSALSVPAAHGIPVTHRGISRAFTVISGHTPLEPDELHGLVSLGGTIVILMGVANLTQIVTGLGRAGLSHHTPVAVVERGFSETERRTFTSLGELPAEARRLEISSPAVIVVGEVVRVAPEYVDAAVTFAAAS